MNGSRGTGECCATEARANAARMADDRASSPFIDTILEADLCSPPKQRNCADANCDRAPDAKVAKVTIRRYARERERDLGWRPIPPSSAELRA